MASFVESDSSESTCPCEDEESLLVSYGAVTSQFNFTGANDFRRCCLNRERDFLHGASNYNEYILFTGVSLQDMMVLDRVRSSLPKMCCLHDATEEVLIVKLMVGIGHETSSIGFLLILTDKLRDLGLRDEIQCTGSTRFGDGRRRKEADQSFKPRGRRPAIDAWPSLTYEVGFAESLPQLRNDARFWLTRSQLQTNIVLLIHIDTVQRQIQIERWEVVNPQHSHCRTVQYAPTIGCVQTIVLKEGDVYMGPPLKLLLEKVFDTVPPSLPAGALDFTASELQAWSVSFWLDFP